MVTIRARVLKILENYPETRNDDKLLYLEVLKDMELIIRGSLGYLIKAEIIDQMPSFESIRRRREEIQNDEHRFIPTEPEVLEKRQFYKLCPRELLSEEGLPKNYLDAVCQRCPKCRTLACNIADRVAGLVEAG